MILDGLIDEARRLVRHQFFLRLPLKMRVLDEERQQDRGVAESFVAGDRRRAAVADQFAIRAKPAQQRRAQAAFMRAALRRRHGVAVGIAETLRVVGPGYRPFDLALGFGQIGLARKGEFRQRLAPFER
jgi:hypothetical protein